MSKITISLLMVFMSNIVLATNIELNMELTWENGQGKSKVAKQRVIATLGKEFEIPYSGKESFKIKMNVNDKYELPVNLKAQHKDMLKSDIMIIGKIFTKNNGKEKLIASPQIMTNYKTEAIFEAGDSNGELVQLKITTKKK